MSDSDAKIKNCKLLKKYIYQNNTIYHKKTKLTQSLQPKPKEMLVTTRIIIFFCFLFLFVDCEQDLYNHKWVK